MAQQDPAAELVAEMVDRARAGRLTLSWALTHVDPGPQGWTTVTRERWARALVADGPLTRALARSRGIAHLAREGGLTHVILDGAPLLSVAVDERGSLRIVSLEPTTCLACDERTRFVQDLVADVRRRGTLLPRLRPGIDLDVSAYLLANPSIASQHWTADLDTYLAVDTRVAQLLATAVVTGHDDTTVSLRYADGRTDRWTVTWNDRIGWRVDYLGLAPNSPLRLEGDAAKAWRRTSTERAARLESWRPTTRMLPDGAGIRLGQEAVGAAIDLHTDTVVIAAVDVDASLSAVFRVDPAQGAVLDRLALPSFSSRPTLPGEGWFTGWPVALDATGTRVAVATPDGVFLADLKARTTERAHRPSSSATALTFDTDGGLRVALADGRVLTDQGTTTLDVHGAPVAIASDRHGWSLVTDAGEVWLVDHADGSPRLRHTACAGQATSAAWRPRDGSWLVSCGPASPHGHEIVPWFPGYLEVFGTQPGPPDGATAFSPDGMRYVTPAPDGAGSVLWNDRTDRPEVVLGRRPLHQAVFSGDGDHLLGVTRTGDVIWWDLPRARALHYLVPSSGDDR